MQALIDFVIRNLLALWPVCRINTWQQGMIVRRGHIQREIAAGLHWRWPFLDEVFRWPVSECTVDLDACAITTRDGQAITVSANLGYRMTSIRTMWAALWNTDTAIRNIARGTLATHCALETWDYLITQRVDLEARLLLQLQQQFDPWGVRIVRVHLTDLAHSRVFRLYHDKSP